MPLTVSQPSDSGGRKPIKYSEVGSGRCNGPGGGRVVAITEPVLLRHRRADQPALARSSAGRRPTPLRFLAARDPTGETAKPSHVPRRTRYAEWDDGTRTAGRAPAPASRLRGCASSPWPATARASRSVIKVAGRSSGDRARVVRQGVPSGQDGHVTEVQRNRLGLDHDVTRSRLRHRLLMDGEVTVSRRRPSDMPAAGCFLHGFMAVGQRGVDVADVRLVLVLRSAP